MSNKEMFREKQNQELKLKLVMQKQAQFQLRASKEAEKVAVNIPFIYAKKLGKTLPVTVNGVTISIPVDGNTYYIPYYFKDIVDNNLRQINTEEKRASQNFGNHQGDVSPTGKVPGRD